MEGEEMVLGAGTVVRQNLQQRLLDAVKQCQIHFGARQEMATETDLRVATLCVEWEAVLLHGMKRHKSKPPLKQFAGLSKPEISLWPLAQLCLGTEEMQRFLHLTHVRTDIGRGRAWLRAAINERTLETYLQLILAKDGKLQMLYELHAFLLDQERSSMLPVMAAGLSSILFSISVDTDYLNTPARNLDIPAVATPTSALLEIQSNHHSPQEDSVVMNKKKRRKKPGHSPSPGSQSQDGSNRDDVEVGVADSTDVGDGSQEGVADAEIGGGALLQLGVALRESSENLSSSPSICSDLDSVAPRFVALDTALLGNHSSSEAEAEAAVSATAMVLSATLSSSSSSSLHRQPQESGYLATPQGAQESGYLATPQGAQESGSLATPQGAHTLSSEELREALLVMVKTKDELEEANKQLAAQLQEVRSERDQLALDLSRSQTELTSLHSTHTQQQALERENDLLKEQLKLMVKRRDTLRLEESTESGSVREREGEVASNHPPSWPHPLQTTSNDDKLSKMADMHAEIVELNDRLQRDMAHKDNYITRLINTIQEAGLQVPTLLVPTATTTQSTKAINDADKNELISVWIPSVIKRVRGPDAHHIYQVFVRIRDQEWNVYRRYAEFREFHKQLQQCIPEVNTFQFPPKKAIGNKSAQLVEERRQRLQDYLRVVVRLCTEPRTVQGTRRKHQLDPIMKQDIDRETLQDILPFFKEDMHSPTNTISQSSHRPSYSGL